jgi:L-iditol 2-dehydrogenase
MENGTMRTRSAFFKAPWQIEIRQVDLPDVPPEGYALVDVDACSICGSDVLWAEHGIPGIDDFSPFGHEVAGRVAALGEGNTALQIGDRVVFQSSVFCGRCERCLNGRIDLCKEGPSVWDRRALGFSDRMLAPAISLTTCEGLPPEVACLTEPAGVGFDLVKEAGIAMGERVCLVGPGPIGLVALALAIHRGAIDVTCIGLPHDVKRLDIARGLGAQTVAHEGPLDGLVHLRERFDHILLTAPPNTIPGALSLLAYGGRLTFIGLAHGDPNVTLDLDAFHFRKLQLRASMASPALYFPAVIALIQNGVIPAERLISHRFCLADIKEAMRVCREDRENVVKVVVTPR